MMTVNLLRHGFAQPRGLGLFTLLPVLALLALLARRRRRKRVARLCSWPAREGLLANPRQRRFLAPLTLLVGLTVLMLGIAGPQWGLDARQVSAPGRDLMVLLDLSRSMLSEDVLGQTSPNRLGRARDALIELANSVQRRGGHRLGLVVFAARAKVVCPLTHDYDHFRDTLARLDPDDLLPEIGPEATVVSGTRLGEGVRQAVLAHDPRFHGHQDILLLSDGDDPAHDNEWQLGVTAARAQAIPVHTVGVGDPEKSSPIPLAGGGSLHHKGQRVLTRLEEKPLQEIAGQTGGTYMPARTRALSLGELFQERIEPGPGHEEAEDTLPGLRQRYPWFFGSALLLLALVMIQGDRGRAFVERTLRSHDKQVFTRGRP